MKVIASVLNVRSGPGTQHNVVGTLKRGESVTVLESSGDWVALEKPCGWVAARYLSGEAAIGAAPRGVDEIIRRFGPAAGPAASAGRVTLPAPLKLGWENASVTVVSCHAEMETVFAGVFAELYALGLWPSIKTYDGIYNPRQSRGSGKWSTHAWGIAIDLNASGNRMGRPGNMPSGIVAVFEEAGFTWGGRWSGKSLDPMHFQYARDY